MKRKSIKFAGMTIQEAKRQLLFQLYAIYDDREAANIADWVLEHITGLKKIDRIIHKSLPLLPHQLETLEKYTLELLDHRPVQYVLNEAWFCGLEFRVNEAVLIPRPETEELVEWIVSDLKDERESKRIVDIGTGSGCIPIALAKKTNAQAIAGYDVSLAALEVARQNAALNEAAVEFFELNFLDTQRRKKIRAVDILVSNPPYIRFSEKSSMPENVVKHEPHLALFVEDDDALIFYKAIAEFCREQDSAITVYVELNEELAQQVKTLFHSSGFTDIVIKEDLQGKDRMIRATYS